MFRSPTNRKPRSPRPAVADGWLLAALLTVTLGSLGWIAWDRQDAPAPMPAAATPATVAPDEAIQLVDRPIDAIRVGERVWGEIPDRDAVDHSLPEPEESSWRLLRLTMVKGDGGRLDVELLRPLAWIRGHQARVGATIDLDLPELGAAGPAEVLVVEPCPPIAPGPGQVVTGTFHHRSSFQVLDVRIEGEDEPIGVTANHPIWSETRAEFVPAGELQVGEELRTLTGATHVESITARGPPEPVYNLEVHAQHVYQVAASGVLVHNQCSYNADQTALQELVNEATLGGRKPLRVGDAETILDWANQIGYPGVRAGASDVSGAHWRAPHINIPGMGRHGHVPVDPGVLPR